MCSATCWPCCWGLPTRAATRAHAGCPDPGTRARCRIRCAPSPGRSSRQRSLWRPYMARHRQNLVWQYHNGGIWPMVGGFWVAALVAAGRKQQARAELLTLARACAVRDWAFTEWLHGKTLRRAECRGSRGMPRRF